MEQFSRIELGLGTSLKNAILDRCSTVVLLVYGMDRMDLGLVSGIGHLLVLYNIKVSMCGEMKAEVVVGNWWKLVGCWWKIATIRGYWWCTTVKGLYYQRYLVFYSCYYSSCLLQGILAESVNPDSRSTISFQVNDLESVKPCGH